MTEKYCLKSIQMVAFLRICMDDFFLITQTLIPADMLYVVKYFLCECNFQLMIQLLHELLCFQSHVLCKCLLNAQGPLIKNMYGA